MVGVVDATSGLLSLLILLLKLAHDLRLKQCDLVLDECVPDSSSHQIRIDRRVFRHGHQLLTSSSMAFRPLA